MPVGLCNVFMIRNGAGINGTEIKMQYLAPMFIRTVGLYPLTSPCVDGSMSE